MMHVEEWCTWLGTLGNLNLQLISIGQELGSDTKAPTGNLHHASFKPQ